MTFEKILKFNPYHDARGRFTSAANVRGARAEADRQHATAVAQYDTAMAARTAARRTQAETIAANAARTLETRINESRAAAASGGPRPVDPVVARHTEALRAARSALGQQAITYGLEAEQATVVAEAFTRSNINGERAYQGRDSLRELVNAGKLTEAQFTDLNNRGVTVNNAAAALHSARQNTRVTTQEEVERRIAEDVARSTSQAMRDWDQSNPEPVRPARPETDPSMDKHWRAELPSPKKLAAIMADPEKRLALHKQHIEMLRANGISINGSSREDAAELARKWDRVTGGRITMAEVVGAQFGTLNKRPSDPGGRGSISVEFSDGHMTLEASDVYVHGARTTDARRTFDFRSGHAYHALYRVDKRDQGGGAATRMFRNAIPMYEKLGMKTVGVTPGLDAGAHTWTRFGFKSKSGSVGLGESAVRHMESKIGNPSALNKKEREQYDALKSLVKTARDMTRGSPEEREAVQYFPNALTSLKVPQLAKRMGYMKMKTVRDENGKVVIDQNTGKPKKEVYKDSRGRTYGDSSAFFKQALYNGGWDSGGGIIEFKDSVQMDYVRKYAGIKTKKPAAAARKPRATRTAAPAAAAPAAAPASPRPRRRRRSTAMARGEGDSVFSQGGFINMTDPRVAG